MGENQYGGEERRLHIHAYDMWASRLLGRAYPALKDLDAPSLSRFRDRSALIRFDGAYDRPVLAHVGDALLEDCEGLAAKGDLLDAAPRESILWHVGHHYMEVLGNKAAISFEAEYERREGILRRYRGILMPLSDNDAKIHFIFCVMNWRDDPIAARADAAEELPAFAEEGTNASLAVEAADAYERIYEEDIGETQPDSTKTAEPEHVPLNAETGSSRSRSDLYAMLTDAYGQAVEGMSAADGGRAALAAAGLKAQARAPFTPWLKIVFGHDYDKTRLAEYALALRHAQRHGVGPSGLENFLSAMPGGIKGCVRAERAAGNGEKLRHGGKNSEASLAGARAVALSVPLDLGDAAYSVVVARRGSAPGTADLLPPLELKPQMLRQLLELAAKGSFKA